MWKFYSVIVESDETSLDVSMFAIAVMFEHERAFSMKEKRTNYQSQIVLMLKYSFTSMATIISHQRKPQFLVDQRKPSNILVASW